MKYFLIIIPLIFIFSIGFCQKAPSEIDQQELKKIIHILTADSLEGRGTGTEGQKKAGKYINESFKRIGLSPFHQGSYFENFELKQSYWGEVYLETAKVKLINFENMVFQGRTVYHSEVEREIVFGGRGTEEELNQIDVVDRFVFIFAENLRAGSEISRILAKRKAFGVILANPKNEVQFESIKRTFKDFSLAKRFALQKEDNSDNRQTNWDTIKSVNSILIPNSQIKNVMGLSMAKLKKLIEQNKISEAPTVKVKAKFERVVNNIETTNIVGILEGKTDKTIVVTAHYDHLGKTDKKYFPGADDNASGVAALLELAEYFSSLKNLNYSMMFLAVSAEEAGLLGSSFHVNKDSFNPENILCTINIDMISRIDDRHEKADYLYCIGSDQSENLDKLIKEADQSFADCSFDYSMNNTKDPLGIFTRSDHYNFYKKGIPSLFFFSGLHQDYHKTTDTPEKINYKNLEYRVQLIAQVIEQLQKKGLTNE